jgi:RND family efflux transporter MFP subunit
VSIVWRAPVGRAGVAILFFALTACGGAAPDGAAEPDEHAEGSAAPVQVTLSAAGIESARIAVEAARLERDLAAADRAALEVPGTVELDPRRVALVSSRIAGRLEKVLVVEGDAVEAGQAVAELFSPEFLAAQSDVQLSARRARLLATTADSTGATALAAAAVRRLELMAVSASEIEALRSGGAPQSTFVLRAPFAGRVVKGHLIAGGAIEAGEPIVTVADLSEVDVVAQVPEVSLGAVRLGRRATITVAAFPELRFTGEVERLRDLLDPETRTVPAVLHVPNLNGVLRPGMYAAVRVETGAAQDGQVLTVPASAIVTDGAAQVVFVAIAERTFERREVRVESLSLPGSVRTAGSRVRVIDGLRAGEKVVIRGAFTVKSELSKAAFSEDDH